MTDPIVKTLTVPLGPEIAFNLFTRQMATWWPLDRHALSARDGQVALDVTVEPHVGGQVIETKHDGSKVAWGQVQEWSPGARFAMTWQLDRPEDEATRLLVTFEATEGGTQVTLTHDGWDKVPADAQGTRGHYASGWDYVFCDRFKASAS